MKKSSRYLMILLFLTMIMGLNSCSNNDENVQVEQPIYQTEKIPVKVGSQTFVLSLFDNETGRAFKELLPLTISMEDVNSNEKFYRLGQCLPGSASNPGTIRNGDLMAYGGNGLVLFYKTFSTSYSYARIGTIDNPSELETALGSGTVSITFGESSEVKKISLTYNINGATSGSIPSAITENEGTSITLSDGAGLSRTGYSFAGWNTNADGTGTDYVGGSNYTLVSDVTLYAKWNQVQQSHTLTYNINGATSGSTPSAVTENEGTSITLSDGSGFSRTGYSFAGWNAQSDGRGTDYAGGSNYTLISDVTLYAKWNQVQQNSNTLKIKVGNNTFTATLANNATATAFKALLPMTINMSELNRNEKYYDLPNSLPSNSSNPGTIRNGDLMLYGSRTFVLFYKTFSTSYSYTRIGSIDNPSGLENALGTGNVSVTFEMQ